MGSGRPLGAPAIRCAAYTDVQVLSALRTMVCDSARSHFQCGLFLPRAYLQVGHVSCGTNTLTSPPLSHRIRRVALAVLDRCNSFEERRDLAGCATCIASSAERAASGTSRKPTH
jgi:hypothetical protein